jgi:hypothetical protein
LIAYLDRYLLLTHIPHFNFYDNKSVAKIN